VCVLSSVQAGPVALFVQVGYLLRSRVSLKIALKINPHVPSHRAHAPPCALLASRRRAKPSLQSRGLGGLRLTRELDEHLLECSLSDRVVVEHVALRLYLLKHAEDGGQLRFLAHLVPQADRLRRPVDECLP